MPLALGLSGVVWGQTRAFPVMVGDRYESASAALAARGIATREEAATGAGTAVSGPATRRLVYTKGTETVTLDFETRARPGESSALVLTRIRSVAPGSDARRDLVRSFEKEEQRWAYLTPVGERNRTAADRQRYPVGASLQWWTGKGGKRAPSVSFLFQAARAPGAKPGGEETALDILLEDPRQPRRF